MSCGSSTVVPEKTTVETPTKNFSPSEKIYLSIDGGAMMGLIPLVLLADLEQETGKKIHELLDGIIGTSTGAIIGALLTATNYRTNQTYTAAEALQFYKDAKNDVFSDANLMKAILGSDKAHAKTEMGEKLEQKLDANLAGYMLSQAKAPLKIVSFEKGPDQIYVFDSIEAKKDPNLDLRMMYAVRASTAFTVLFDEAQVIFDNQTLKRTFIDAGDASVPDEFRIVDPTYLLFDDLKKSGVKKATIYSLGTGFLDGPSSKTNLKDAEIKVVRLDPDLKSYLATLTERLNKLLIVFKSAPISARQIRNVAAGAPALGDLNSIQVFLEAGEALKSSEPYKNMLDDIKERAKATAH